MGSFELQWLAGDTSGIAETNIKMSFAPAYAAEDELLKWIRRHHSSSADRKIVGVEREKMMCYTEVMLMLADEVRRLHY